MADKYSQLAARLHKRGPHSQFPDSDCVEAANAIDDQRRQIAAREYRIKELRGNLIIARDQAKVRDGEDFYEALADKALAADDYWKDHPEKTPVKERDEAKAWSDKWEGLSEISDKAVIALTTEIARLREALTWYSNTENHRVSHYVGMDNGMANHRCSARCHKPIEMDKGDLARAALAPPRG